MTIETEDGPRNVYRWMSCDCCGGALPTIDGDNDHPDLPVCPNGGDCPGHTTEDGICGAWEGASLTRFAARAARERVGEWS